MQYAKIHVLDQSFTNLFDIEDALIHGTVFKDLYEPYKYNPKKKSFVSKKEQLLYIIMQYRFFIWDLHLYLDTHPDNKECLALIERATNDLKRLEVFYEKNFDIFTHDKESEDSKWITSPWPSEGENYVEV